MHTKEDIDKLAMEFEQCQKILVALGDENRQHMILEMMKMGDCSGARVNEITEKTHLSRPAGHWFHRKKKYIDFFLSIR